MRDRASPAASAVVECVVVTELVDEGTHLGGSSGASDHTGRSEELGETSSSRADGTSGRRDEHDVAWTHLRDAGETDVGGETGLAEDAEPRTRRCGVDVNDAHRRCIDNCMLPPAEAMADDRPGCDRRTQSVDHHADRRAVERLPELEVGGVVLLGRLEPPAHRRIDAHDDIAQEQLSWLQWRQWAVLEGKVLRYRTA